MRLPTRIQRRRTPGFKLPPSTKCCTRPGKFSNPFRGKFAIECYRLWLRHPGWDAGEALRCFVDEHGAGHTYIMICDKAISVKAKTVLDSLPELFAFEHLACFCAVDSPCHVDVLIEKLKEIRP